VVNYYAPGLAEPLHGELERFLPRPARGLAPRFLLRLRLNVRYVGERHSLGIAMAASYPKLGLRLLLSEGARLMCLAACALAGSSCSREPCQKLFVTPREARGAQRNLTRGDLEPTPRCDSADPTCGPMPMRSAENRCYRPSKARLVVPAGDDDQETSRSQYSCTHDGECEIAGCGNVCVSYREAEIQTSCLGYGWLAHVEFCGCVDGTCSFFRQ
jgi:hypothetical protein